MHGSVYFVTWRLAKHQPALGADERTVVMTTIKHFEIQQYRLPAYVVMDDHAHVLVQPLGDFELHSIAHSWKSFSSKQLAKGWARTPPLWQQEYFDRIVRDEKELVQKADYILSNPWNRWPFLQEYQWVGVDDSSD
jgi:REP element-mobilizing transposase RayT